MSPECTDFDFIGHSCHCGEVGHRAPGLSKEEKQLAMEPPPWFHPILTARPWWPVFPGRPACPALP